MVDWTMPPNLAPKRSVLALGRAASLRKCNGSQRHIISEQGEGGILPSRGRRCQAHSTPSARPHRVRQHNDHSRSHGKSRPRTNRTRPCRSTSAPETLPPPSISTASSGEPQACAPASATAIRRGRLFSRCGGGADRLRCVPCFTAWTRPSRATRVIRAAFGAAEGLRERGACRPRRTSVRVPTRPFRTVASDRLPRPRARCSDRSAFSPLCRSPACAG